jgi:hypothetical protein
VVEKVAAHHGAVSYQNHDAAGVVPPPRGESSVACSLHRESLGWPEGHPSEALAGYTLRLVAAPPPVRCKRRRCPIATSSPAPAACDVSPGEERVQFVTARIQVADSALDIDQGSRRDLPEALHTHYIRFRTDSVSGSYRLASRALYAGDMDRSAELFRLQKEVAAAMSECTAAMNEQFLAVIADDPDVSRFDAKIAEAGQKRRRAMDNLLNHIRQHGW